MRIASVCFCLLAEKFHTPQELIKEFEQEPLNFFPKLDGSEGIKIIDCTQFEIDPSQFSILYVEDNHHE